jgi:small ligand-binding sensory domain FIST
VPYGGFYSTGEIARVRGALGMHHFTVVTLALS